ncbi:MAG: aminotransferase class V-fold PLP-dependent enzyme [Planctomycetota bacterium]|jgi:selenocysteine lyase/cysteine desulfurase
MPNWTWVRNQFPIRKNYAYFSAASSAAIPECVIEAASSYYREMGEKGDIGWRKWLDQVEAARRRAARVIGTKQENVAFTTNTSSGMAIAAGLLEGCGDVLTMREEFPASTYPWLNRGYKVKFVDPEPDHTYPIEKIEKAITKKTKILVSSFVQFGTGFRQDIEALGKLAKKRKLIFVVNAIQGLAIFPMKAEKWGVDFLTSGAFKWMMSGYGTGMMYVSPKLRRKYRLPMAGWRSVNNPMALDTCNFRPKNDASVFEVGCPHMPNIAAINAALGFFEKIGYGNITKRVLALTDRIIARLDKHRIPVTSPLRKKHRSGIVIAKAKNAPIIADMMLDQHKVYVAPRGGGIRFAPHIYNSFAECDRGVDALAHCIEKLKKSKGRKRKAKSAVG